MVGIYLNLFSKVSTFKFKSVLFQLTNYIDTNTTCCKIDMIEQTADDETCFIPIKSSLITENNACFDPSEILLDDPVNCTNVDDESVCIKPHPLAHLIRIGFIGKNNEEESILLQSSKQFVWENRK